MELQMAVKQKPANKLHMVVNRLRPELRDEFNRLLVANVNPGLAGQRFKELLAEYVMAGMDPQHAAQLAGPQSLGDASVRAAEQIRERHGEGAWTQIVLGNAGGFRQWWRTIRENARMKRAQREFELERSQGRPR